LAGGAARGGVWSAFPKAIGKPRRRHLMSHPATPTADASLAAPLLVIEAGRTERNYWLDLWRYRELFLVLAWRDIAVRYKQTAIGVTWALIQPLLIIVVFTFIFGSAAGMEAPPGVPYPLLVAAGTIAWQFFATALQQCSNSLIANRPLLAKVYFPRLVLPASSVIVAFVDFLISFVILAGVILWTGFLPSWQIVFLPVLVLIVFATSMAIGIWFAALNVEFRDFRYIVPFVVQFGVFISPVGFQTSEIVDKLGSLGWLVYLNPMVGVIDGFRWCLIGGDSPVYLPGFLGSIAITLALLFAGIVFFRRVERTFADII
jgi:lipopolysaccharide transport system permease protein